MSLELTALAQALARLNARQADVLLSTSQKLSAPWPAERWGTTPAAFEVLLLRALQAFDAQLLGTKPVLLRDADEAIAIAALKADLLGVGSSRSATLLRALEANHVALTGRVEALRRTQLQLEAASPWRWVRQGAFVLLVPVSAYLFWKNEPATFNSWVDTLQRWFGGGK